MKRAGLRQSRQWLDMALTMKMQRFIHFVLIVGATLFANPNFWVVEASSASGRGWGMQHYVYRSGLPGRDRQQRQQLNGRNRVPARSSHLAIEVPDVIGTPTMSAFPRGGGVGAVPSATASSAPPLVEIAGAIFQIAVSAGKVILPAIVGFVGAVVGFYKALPIDAITAQIGLVYCFLGGYYPTLFSSLQAARYCGWHVAVDAIADLTDEAVKVLDELDATDSSFFGGDSPRDLFLHKANVVLKTVDPMKINEATGALYTTWLGVSTVLQKEYARTISLALTLAEGLENTIGALVLGPILRLATPNDYRRWVPAIVGWASKAVAMRVAWRIERVLTAATSALAGGAIVARSITKLVRKHRAERKELAQQKQQQQQLDVRWRRRWTSPYPNKRLLDPEDDYDTNHDFDDIDDDDAMILDADGREPALSLGENLLGFAVGGVGFYTQMECQYKRSFSFVVPFPWSLATWPFDLAERWIQWYITKY